MPVPGLTVALRVLLLLATALGVAGMHTMGHPTGNHSGSGSGSAFGHPFPHPQPEAVAAPSVVEPASQPRAAPVRPGHDLDPSTACLAILTLIGLTGLIVAGLLAARHRTHLATSLRGILPTPGRGPPRCPSYGLLLADLSVLRR
ncbi:hypothetical protein [Micromonospora sonneratiae]|uniref:MYXO-CTERM domain-containing protein n=1 Tax=Micromonospora sonneratiae TaxID=1184706 RepID=A0ABW3YDI2_9ACTN